MTCFPTWTARSRDDSGAVAALVAPLILALVIPLLAVTVDIGRVFVSRSAAQNAADQAASAAAWASCTGHNPTAAAQASAQRNGFAAGTDTAMGTVTALNVTDRGGGSWGVAVTVDVDGVFGPLIGTDTVPVPARAAASCAAPPPAAPLIYGHSTTCADTIQFTGNNLVINGEMHSNRNLRVTSTNFSHTGVVTYAGALTTTGSHINWLPSAPTKVGVRTWPLWYDINDFDTGGVYASRADYVAASGTTTINNTWLSARGYLVGGVIAPRIYYTDGAISISGNTITGTATFVSRGAITTSGNNLRLRPYFLDIGAFSNSGGGSCGQNAISISGNNTVMEGIFFAPNGRISQSGNNMIYRAIVANEFQVSGNNLTLTGGNRASTEDPTVTLDVW